MPAHTGARRGSVPGGREVSGAPVKPLAIPPAERRPASSTKPFRGRWNEVGATGTRRGTLLSPEGASPPRTLRTQ